MIWKTVRSEPRPFRFRHQIVMWREQDQREPRSDYYEDPPTVQYIHAGLLLTCRLFNIEASCVANPIRVMARFESLYHVIQSFQSRLHLNIDELRLRLDHECPIGKQTFDADNVQTIIATTLLNLKRYYKTATFTKICFLWIVAHAESDATGHHRKVLDMACDFAVRSPLPHTLTLPAGSVPPSQATQPEPADALATEKQILQASLPLRDFDRLLNQSRYLNGSPIVPGTNGCLLWYNRDSIWDPFSVPPMD